MSELSVIVVNIVSLNGGSLVGKTRLQKTVYLLEQCGMGEGIDFDYHHYGPFSRDLTHAVSWALLEKKLSERDKASSHGTFSEFCTKEVSSGAVGNLAPEQVSEYLGILRKFNSIELELAATVHYLRHHGYTDNAEQETRLRKPSKATSNRMARAGELLEQLGIAA